MDDYYKILGLEKNCNENDIKKAYYKLARENHPDKVEQSQREEATKKFQKIGEAYEVLSDPEKRNIYNMHGKEGLNGNNVQMNPFDIFSMFNFGNFNNFNNFNNSKTNMKRKNKETIFQLPISLKDVYLGLHKKLKVTKKIIVKKETKEKVNIKDYEKTWNKCEICKGEGIIIEMKKVGPSSFFQNQKHCTDCESKGYKISKEYEIIEVSEVIEIDIPKGVKNNHSLTFPNQGNCSAGTFPGDLIIIINCNDKENDFTRKNNDLIYEKKILLEDALCGTNFKLETLDNRILSLSFSEVIIPGDRKIIPNEGINKGNLIIIFEIIFPATISSNKKEKLRKLLKETNKY